MTMQRGFGAAPDMAPPVNQGDPLMGSGIFHVSTEDGKNRRTTVLLDDEPVWGYRHKIKRPYVPGVKTGDWKERDIRVTCAVANSKEDRPRECLICEAAIRNNEVIKRVFTANLTCIDMGEHRTKKNNVYYDLKKLLELDWAAYETFREQKKAVGGLVGMVFSVLRPGGDPKQSKTYGVWTPLQRVNLMQHFYASPAVRNIMEMAGKRGERITQQDAVQRLIAPIDYNKELNNYTPQIAERFVMRAVSRAGSTASEAGGFQGGGGFQGAPQGYGGGFQQQGFQGAQGGFGAPQQGFQGAQTMSPHQVPDYSTAPQQPQAAPQGYGQQPMGQPQGFTPPGFGQPQSMPQGFGGAQGSVPPPPANGPQGYQAQQPMAPPQVGNPMNSTPPPGFQQQPQGLPPQQPQAQPSLAPSWASQPPLPGQQQPQTMMQPGMAPPGMQQQFPQAAPPQQPQPQQPQGGGYGFDQQPGWGAQFPGAPQGQPQQPMMQQPQGFPQMQPPPQPQMQPQFQGAPGFGGQMPANIPPPPSKLPF